MKKYFYLLMLALMPMCFTACGGDDEASGVASVTTLYGTWQATHGVAMEDGSLHHDKDISADEAEYLHFGKDGFCIVIGGDHGHFYSDGSFSFSFDEKEKTLTVGYKTFVVEALSGNTLKLKDVYGQDSQGRDEYVLVTYKKVSDSVWENL
ncbi:MAG: hypothetical protein IJ633_07715 [Prevotella sp.]|nr:hypothetical protein [Prevotella sp.]